MSQTNFGPSRLRTVMDKMGAKIMPRSDSAICAAYEGSQAGLSGGNRSIGQADFDLERMQRNGLKNGGSRKLRGLA